MVLARKHDGTFCMCVDYRKLNQCTVKDAQPLPRSDDVLEAVGGARWFSCLDLASGYWQMQVADKDRPKTAFSTHRGQFQWTFVLDTDASQRLGIGAVLSQVQPGGTERVVAYGSRSLNDHERNYCTTRLEMLALVTYVDYFRYYLAGCKFLVRTDHHSLKWLMSFREPEGQIARWLERLQEYDFEVEHRAGKSHCNADAMSRKPRRFHGDCPSCGPTEPLRTRVFTLTPGHSKVGEDVTPGNLWSVDAIAQAQREDPDIGPVLGQYLKKRKKPPMRELQSLSSTSSAIWARCELIEVADGVLCIRSEKISPPRQHRVVLPASLVQSARKECHDAVAGGHLRREKTLQKFLLAPKPLQKCQGVL